MVPAPVSGYGRGSGIRPANPTPLRCCRTGVEGDVQTSARWPGPLPRSTRRMPPIENAPGYSLERTYAQAGEPRDGPRGGAMAWSGWERPDARRGRAGGRYRDECGVTATSEHPDHTLVATGCRPNISRFSVAVVGLGEDDGEPGTDRRCNHLQRLDVRAPRESEGLSRGGPWRLSVRQVGQCFAEQLGGIRACQGERLVAGTPRPDVEDVVWRLPDPLLMALERSPTSQGRPHLAVCQPLRVARIIWHGSQASAPADLMIGPAAPRVIAPHPQSLLGRNASIWDPPDRRCSKWSLRPCVWVSKPGSAVSTRVKLVSFSCHRCGGDLASEARGLPFHQLSPRSVVAEPHPVSERPITVLVAEDEDLVRRLVSQLLGDQGYRILEARDGVEALHLAHLASPHLRLVVADVVMPGMDGWELGRRLAIDCPGVPVLYMSAYPRADIFHRGESNPSVPFLEKPFSAEVFVRTVRELLERAAPSAGALPLRDSPTSSSSALDPSAPQTRPDPAAPPSESSLPAESAP
jgi:CheY-like chemotaxis protein